MATNKKAGAEVGPKHFRPQILAFILGTFKAALVSLTLWHLLPCGLAEWLIRRFRLRGA